MIRFVINSTTLLGLTLLILRNKSRNTIRNTEKKSPHISTTSSHNISLPKLRKKRGRRRKLRFDLSFDGSCYSGWQYHPDTKRPSVYTVVAAAWQLVTNEQFGPVAAARLDTGVSADHQICSVRTQKEWTEIELESLLLAFNTRLPSNIQCFRILNVNIKFHAINAPQWKRYGYAVQSVMPNSSYSCQNKEGFESSSQRRCWYRQGGIIDEELVRNVCLLFQGTHDFRHFTSKSGPWEEDYAETEKEKQTKDSKERDRLPSAVRTIYKTKVTRGNDGTLLIQMTGNGFMKHMVRRCVGVALAVGSGMLSMDAVQVALKRNVQEWEQMHRSFDFPLRHWLAPTVGLTLEKIYVKGDDF